MGEFNPGIHSEIIFYDKIEISHSVFCDTDFGAMMYGEPFSDEYYEKISPVFDILEDHEGESWKNLPKRAEAVTTPFLNAFAAELENGLSFSSCSKFVSHFINVASFYRMTFVESSQENNIELTNIAVAKAVKCECLLRELMTVIEKNPPERIIFIGFPPHRKTELELYLDKGWQFRISLKFSQEKIIPYFLPCHPDYRHASQCNKLSHQM